MKKIIHYLTIEAPINKVWQAIATIDGLSKWWSTHVTGGEKEGELVEFEFMEIFSPKMKITRMKEPQSLKWKCTGGHEPWQDNEFIFELNEEHGATKLLFVQEYKKSISDKDYGTYNYNWAYYLQSLQEYCVSGKGKPFQPQKG